MFLVFLNLIIKPKKKVLNEDARGILKNNGSELGICDVPLRPILSMVIAFNFSLSKLLVHLVTRLCNSPYVVMASFDGVSLFTNIPVNLNFNNIENIPCNGTDTDYICLSRELFKSLYDLCCKDIMFLFDNQLCEQVDGAPMGGCVSSSLAEIFMNHH